MKLCIEGLSNTGKGIARTEEGKVCFVERALPGDIVCARVLEEHKNYLVAETSSYSEKSQMRAAFVCPYKDVCLGCVIGEVPYKIQLDYKKRWIEEAFSHIAQIDLQVSKITASPTQKAYRNKIELSREKCGATYKLGFFGTSFVPIKNCLLFQGDSGLIPQIEGILNYLEDKTQAHVYRITLRTSIRTGERELALWTTTGPFNRAMAATLFSKLPITSLVRVQTKDESRARKVVNVERLLKQGSWHEKLDGFVYKVSAPSFFQVNTEVGEKLLRHVMHEVQKEPPAVALDLFSGVGTFTVPLARVADRVVSFEAEKSAVRDLCENISRMPQRNVEIVGGDVGKRLGQYNPDLVILDPPRAGLHKSAQKALMVNAPQTILYVSCNPTTLARDVATFEKSGYRIKTCSAFDMFPNTPHVETCVRLEKEA